MVDRLRFRRRAAARTPKPVRVKCRAAEARCAWNGREPVTLADGSTRTFLEDGDEVTVTAWAPGADGTRIGLGSVTGRILPAVS